MLPWQERTGTKVLFFSLGSLATVKYWIRIQWFRGCCKTTALSRAVLKAASKSSFTTCKLRFIGDFCLPRLSLVTFCNTLFTRTAAVTNTVASCL